MERLILLVRVVYHPAPFLSYIPSTPYMMQRATDCMCTLNFFVTHPCFIKAHSSRTAKTFGVRSVCCCWKPCLEKGQLIFLCFYMNLGFIRIIFRNG